MDKQKYKLRKRERTRKGEKKREKEEKREREGVWQWMSQGGGVERREKRDNRKENRLLHQRTAR